MRDLPISRWFAPLAWAMAAALVAPTAGRVHADDAKPAKKDSRPAARPKEATFKTSVTPAEAKPGDTVSYKVTAKIDAPWHIYKYSKEESQNGPKYTEFDFFDTAGLKVDGDWSPSSDPIKKKEPAFPDIPFLEFHEDEVTWSIKLKVPLDAKAGKKTLRCQIGYMLCSDQNCSFPGQWTLPDAELTISSSPKLLYRSVDPVSAALIALIPQAGPPKPKVKDSRPVTRKATTFTTKISPDRARPGDRVSLQVTAKVDAPWHIYGYSKTQPDEGPILTNFDVFDPGGLVLDGEWNASRPPIKRKDNNYPTLESLQFFEGEVTWDVPLKIPADAEPGKKAVQVQITYMVCNDNTCSLPIHWTLAPAEVVVDKDAPPAVAAISPPPTVGSSPEPVAKPAPAPPADPAPIRTPPAEVAAGAKAPGPGDSDTPIGGVGGKAAEGIIPFLLFCAGGGLFALAMPCVWPMIPVTVNFFVKQGQKKQGSTTGLAIAYSLSIVLIFMAVGLLFSITFGAASLSKLANNPWLNFGVAALFLAFGLSLLGLFEIRLPNFLLNASSQGESKGGLIGVMFMALTLTITSFTCTFPVVGGLLVMAAKGDLLYPVIGLATFASVLAFPFLLLALSPGLLAKMPKSGDWMNTVKVVGGLIEIGAAFKFINTAEVVFVVPSEAWFNASVVLSIWIMMLLICGIYLLGLFRTDHDYEEVKVGPGRIVFGWVFLSLALFLSPALFGRPPESKVWYLVAGLLPADAADLKAPAGAGGGGGEALAKAATSDDPKRAEREQTSFHGVPWGLSYEGALEKARAAGKPVLIDFTGVNCPNCRVMELEVFPRPEVVQSLGDFVTVQLYTDIVPIKSISPEARLKLAEENLDREIKVFKEATNPNYAVVDPDGNVLGTLGGKVPPREFVGFLKGAREKFKGAAKVAQSGPGD
jgi:thiol:disulfide interchange protein